MIVLAAGMQRSGSAWFFNLSNELVIEAGYSDAREVREEFDLHDILIYTNCMLRGISDPRKMIRLLRPHLAGRTFTIRKHGRPHPYFRTLSRVGIVKPAYIYRDPRDVALSAFERGQQMRAQGQDGLFARLETMEDAIKHAAGLLDAWEEWASFPAALTIRYEDLNQSPEDELRRLSDFLGFNVPEKGLERIVADHSRENLERAPAGYLHLNKGYIGRFESRMDEREKELCQECFGGYLERMGYAS